MTYDKERALTMLCPHCGAENNDDARFCAECGKSVESEEGGGAETANSDATMLAAPEESASEETVVEGSDASAAAQDGAASAPAPTYVVSPAATAIANDAPTASQAEASAAAPAGDRLGPYILQGELGRGAMARVWRAFDPNLEREVAIKEPLFDSNLPENVLEEMGRRFVKEGRAAAKLDHNNIVTIYAADVYDGRPAIVMELVDGTTLGTLMERGKLSPAEALSVLDQLLDAVGYAHKQGVVHRDIKPENIFVNSSGTVKLADFGIAHVEDTGATRATMVGTVLGTPGYMSPEQATGSTVDGRSDLFSVAVVGYEMLSGKNPFGAGMGDSTTILYRIVHEPAADLPAAASEGLPSDVRPAIMAALAKDPNNRPADAASFKAMLHGGMTIPDQGTQGIGGSSALADRVSKGGGLPKWLPWVAAAAVAAGVMIGLFATANNVGGGGGGSTGSTISATTSTTQAAADAYYLSISPDNFVAIYETGKATPTQITQIPASDVPEDIAAKLDDHIGAASLEAAQAEVTNIQTAIDQAAADAEAAAAEAAAAAAAEEQARKEAEGQVVTLTCVGADGSTRSEQIRRQGNTERVFPDSNSRYLSDDEIYALNDAERCVAYNEIIASANGYTFKNSGLFNYFSTNCSSWYVSRGGSGSTDTLSDAGRSNVDRLKNATDGWWKNLATY